MHSSLWKSYYCVAYLVYNILVNSKSMTFQRADRLVYNNCPLGLMYSPPYLIPDYISVEVKILNHCDLDFSYYTCTLEHCDDELWRYRSKSASFATSDATGFTTQTIIIILIMNFNISKNSPNVPSKEVSFPK